MIVIMLIRSIIVSRFTDLIRSSKEVNLKIRSRIAVIAAKNKAITVLWATSLTRAK